MITRRIPFFRILILAELLGSVLWASDKPAVTVKFFLKEPEYRKEYTEAEIKTLEEELSSVIAGIFENRLGFLSFVTSPGPSYSLTLELDRKDTNGPGPYYEVGFKVRMEGPEIRRKTGYWEMFRPRNSYKAALGDLKGAVSLKLTLLDDLAYAKLVEDFLGQVPICCEDTKLLADPLGWVLPYTRTDLSMDWGSQLSIENLLPTIEAGPVGWNFRAVTKKPFESPGDETYHKRILCVAVPGDTDPDKLRQFSANEVSVTKFYVVEYWRFAESLEGIETPDDASH